MIFDYLHVGAALILTVCGILRMNRMTRATPMLDILGWWGITVGAFAHGVLSPQHGVEWADSLLICGGALVVVLEGWPSARELCVANRRQREREQDGVVS